MELLFLLTSRKWNDPVSSWRHPSYKNIMWGTYFNLHSLRGPTQSQDKERDGSKCSLHGDDSDSSFVLQCFCLLLWMCSAGAQLSLCLPLSTTFLLNTPALQPSGHVTRGAADSKAFSHGLMNSNGTLQDCKREFINPTLTSPPVWLFLWILGCCALQNRSHLLWG